MFDYKSYLESNPHLSDNRKGDNCWTHDNWGANNRAANHAGPNNFRKNYNNSFYNNNPRLNNHLLDNCHNGARYHNNLHTNDSSHTVSRPNEESGCN